MDALASRAEEGRSKTAKSLGEPSSRHSRGFPNGVTRSGVEPDRPDFVGGATRRTETSKYPEENTSTEIP